MPPATRLTPGAVLCAAALIASCSSSSTPSTSSTLGLSSADKAVCAEYIALVDERAERRDDLEERLTRESVSQEERDDWTKYQAGANARTTELAAEADSSRLRDYLEQTVEMSSGATAANKSARYWIAVDHIREICAGRE